MSRRTFRFPPAVAFGLLVAAGCAGEVDGEAAGDPDLPGAPTSGSKGAPAPGPTRPGDPTGSVAGGGGSSGVSGAACGRPAATGGPRLWLLSPSQTSNALRDLLGPRAEAVVPPGVTPTGRGTWGAERRLAPVAAMEHAAIVERAVAAAVSPGVEAFTGCAAGAGFDACVGGFLRRFAGRAYRRPLADDEATALRAIYDATKPDGAAIAVSTALEAVLSAPSFLYRVERGQAQPGGAVRLDPHETAAALSFFLRDSIPDEPLAAAAADGRLATPAGLAAEVDRLLREPRVRAHLASLVLAWTPAAKLSGTDKDPKLFPDFAATRPSLQREAELFVERVLWSEPGGGLAALLTSTRTSVDARLAKLYGVTPPAGTGFAPVDLPADERAGIVTQAGILAALSRPEETSVVRRGLWAWNALLCQPELPPPPAEAVQAAADATKDLKTERQLAAYRKGEAGCAVCHSMFDPLGLLFERYDAAGKARPDPGGPAAPVDLSRVVEGGGSVTSAVGLAQALAGAAPPALCLSRALLERAVGVELHDDTSCAVRDAAQALRKPGGSFEALFRALALSPALRERN